MKNIELFATIKMNRPVSEDDPEIVPGGYTLKVPNRTIRFDFLCDDIYTDIKDPSLINIHAWEPDMSYADTEEITVKMLERVQSIEEFFVFTGEKGETDLKPVSVKNMCFAIPGRRIGVPASICKAAKVASNIC